MGEKRKINEKPVEATAVSFEPGEKSRDIFYRPKEVRYVVQQISN